MNFAIKVWRNDHENGFRWAFIALCGRHLVESQGVFPCDFTAVKDARRKSASVRELMSSIDDYREYL